MTTTNFEISKKLAEIGFSRQAFWVWTSKDCCCPFETHLDGFRAYDLETLLDALPRFINPHEELSITKSCIGYFEEESIVCLNTNAICEKQLNESLADTAGRLIIELYEKNLIKF